MGTRQWLLLESTETQEWVRYMAEISIIADHIRRRSLAARIETSSQRTGKRIEVKK
jgi:hypothetical protein